MNYSILMPFRSVNIIFGVRRFLAQNPCLFCIKFLTVPRFTVDLVLQNVLRHKCIVVVIMTIIRSIISLGIYEEIITICGINILRNKSLAL